MHRALILLSLALPAAVRAGPVISEFCADNKTVTTDEEGQFSDWIELHNPDSASTDLTGWALTDNAASPDKWRLPALVLAPGEFRVVFASGKNRRDPAAVLHTNFQLSADGEYLALVRPDLSVAQDFGAEFPGQQTDTSFGIGFQTTKLISEGAAARWLVPSDGSLGASWLAPAFAPGAAWLTGPSGGGFGMLVPGVTVREARSTGSVGNLAAADAVLGGSGVAAQDTRIRSKLNLLGEGNEGRFAGNDAFATGGDNFALRATGTVSIPAAGQWTFGTSSNDGVRLKIDGSTAISDDTQHGSIDNIAAPLTLSAGPHTVELTFFTAVGGDEVELFAASGAHTAFNSAFKLVGDTASGGLAVFTSAGGSPGSNPVRTDLEAAMRGLNASCYARIPFTVSDPGLIGPLTLNLRYNDGFAAWINGVPVAAANAPDPLLWNSSATAPRGLTDSLIPSAFNASAALSSIVTGTNILMVQGLNISAADSTCLVLPELQASSPVSGGPFKFAVPTPGSPNGTPASLGQVADTQFSHKRGFFSAPFQLSLSTATPGAEIRYTTDGSPPAADSGTVYTGPFAVAATTVLRAAAFKPGWDPTNVDTHTYLFTGDVIRQPETAPPGWPATGSTNQRFDYGMDPEIVNHVNPAAGGPATVTSALLALPVVSLVMRQADFSGSNGIYTNASQRGIAWERPASIEMLNDAEGGFQAECGVRVRGNYSRDANNPKHSFRVFFRSEYGDSKLNYRLFGDAGAEEFDGIDIQTPHDSIWAYSEPQRANYLRDVWCRETIGALGQPTTRSGYVHVCINGIYWGLYCLEERPEAAWAETYLGGEKENYDVIKTTGSIGGYSIEATDGQLTGPVGNPAAWENLWNQCRAHNAAPGLPAYFRMQGLAPDGITRTADPVLLDAVNLCDYILWLFHTANTDVGSSIWVGNRANNFFAVRQRGGDRGFIFAGHDTEVSLDWYNTAYDRTGPVTGTVRSDFTSGNPEFFHDDLLANPEYRLLFADRARRALYRGGALSPEACIARFDALASRLEPAVPAESARWGDAQRASPYTRLDWQARRGELRNWFAGRREPLLTHLRNDGLYPATEPPAFSQHGGRIASGASVIMSAPAGQIFYTLDGSDPRLAGGAQNPSALPYQSGTTVNTTLIASGSSWRYLDNGSDQGSAWRTRDFNDSAWKGPAPGQFGYGEGDEATRIEDNAVAGYNASDTNRYITTYFRRTFNVNDPQAVGTLTLEMIRDDGAAVYINGQKVLWPNLPEGELSYTQQALTSVSGADETVFYPYPVSPSVLVQGVNTIAVEVHQQAPDSSDVSFDLRLLARETANAQLLTFSGPAVVTAKARALNSGVWSALEEAEFLVDAERLQPGRLAVSEIMYHPDPDSDAEFIELVNRGPLALDLRGARFMRGISFTFPAATPLLPPGGRIVLIRNAAAFAARYGPGIIIAGVYEGGLDNEGERLVLRSADGTLLLDFSWDDSSPWPTSADGNGRSLVFTGDPSSASQGDPARWRSGTVPGGTPGTADSLGYAAWKAANGVSGETDDSDQDGLPPVLEYALGGSVSFSSTGMLPRIAMETLTGGTAPDVYVKIETPVRLGADDVTLTLEASDGSGIWSPVPLTLLGESNVEGTSAVRTFRSNAPLGSSPRTFWRLRVSSP